MEQGLGFKELYNISLKATYPIEIGGRTIESGETIAYFDKISLANFQEISSAISANGGYDNRAHVWWEETKEVQLHFTQGVFSKTHFALMCNAQLITEDNKQGVAIQQMHHGEFDEKGCLTLPLTPIEKTVYVYDFLTGARIANTDIEIVGNTVKYTPGVYTEVVVDYQYNYTGSTSTLTVGRPLTQGYLSLTGKMRVKDDITGQVKTGIINIPKLKLMSDLSMRLGKDASPVVGQIRAVAIPVGAKGQKKVMEIIFLDDDIDADM